MPAKKKAVTKKPATKKKTAPAKAKPKVTSKKATSLPTFPGESAAYRRARDTLITAEIALRRQTEAVAVLRRKLPLGGAIPEDYVFMEGSSDPQNTISSRPVRMSALFTSPTPTLIVYNFMFGPAMAQPCPMCTSMLDSLDGAAFHVTRQARFVVVAKSPIERLRGLAWSRGWRSLHLLSSAENNYNRDYHGESRGGSQMPMLNVFVKRGNIIHHSYGSELLFRTPDAGQDPRHTDLIDPLWNLLDLTPEGRVAKGLPRLSYGS
jgi:predicted dithiol-disulfide oxidoreductase (DUF899 family)